MILSRAIYSLLGLFLGLVLYMVFIKEMDLWRWGILPIVMIGFLTYIFSSEINHYWLNRYPLQLDQREHFFLSRHFPYYEALSPDKQKEFGEQCIQFHRKRDTILQGLPNFPDDLKVLWSAQALLLTRAMGLSVSDWDSYEKVVLYPHPFISPDIEQVHASETHFEEGIWLFSADQLIPGMTQPTRFFNLALYEFIRTAKTLRPDKFTSLRNTSPSKLAETAESFSNLTLTTIRSWLNIEELDLEAVYLTLLLSHLSVWGVFSEKHLSTLPLASAVSNRLSLKL